MTISFTNQLLCDLLSELGFQPDEATNTNLRVWRHSDSGCSLFLPVNKVNEAARPADIVGIKAQLSLHGHLDEDAFDFFVHEGKLPTASSARRVIP